MSMEDAITRLAYAVERNQQGDAVAEIIRQRDEAFAQRDRWKRDADFYQKSRDQHYEAKLKAERVASALKGVITKMRKGKP